MTESLFEIENWRGGWYYKLGSRYTGPFKRRDAALAAAREEVAPLRAKSSSSSSSSLKSNVPADTSFRGNNVERPGRTLLFGMSFRIPGIGDHA